MPPIHVAITREVKPGCEAEFEAALLEFFQRTLLFPGVLGAQLLRPAHGAQPPVEYGILRTFASEEAKEAFYHSDAFADWQARVAPLVMSEHYKVRQLHGLEAFFRGEQGAPTKWKMAVLTWLGVYPTVTVWSAVLTPLLRPLPHLLAGAIVSAVVVATLAYGVMPFLIRLFGRWLQGPRSGASRRL